MPRLETARLLLRPWREDDIAAYGRMLRDSEVMRYIGAGALYRLKRFAARCLGLVSNWEARRAVEDLQRHWREHGYGEWAVEEKASGTLLGQVGLVHQADWVADSTRIEIGWLMARAGWGRGFATEASRAVLAYGFEQLGAERIISITRPQNRRAGRLMERLGMSFAGEVLWKGGPVHWYVIDRTSWLQGANRGGDAAADMVAK